MADIDNLDEEQDYVVLRTLPEVRKGLEFSNVYPGRYGRWIISRSYKCSDNPEDLEERRLCYVGITRAEQRACAELRKNAYGTRRRDTL